MRVALLSPYSWTYPGGVTRHIESLAQELLTAGHEVRVLAPFDEDRRRTAFFHRGARPQQREIPEWLIPLKGTVGLPANGAVSNLSVTPYALTRMRKELREGNFDVIHIHEPVVPVLGWDALSLTCAPLVGTFHTYNEKPLSNLAAAAFGARLRFNRLSQRIAVSEAAEWMGKRYWGGNYRIIPNGVTLPAEGVPAPKQRQAGEPLKIAFVGQAVERKGLPVLLRAFEALRDEMPVKLTIVGANQEEVAPLLLDANGVSALGRVCDQAKYNELVDADIFCAPSLRGESFGMVLTEAFAAGTPVVASNIAGYRDVVEDGKSGILVPPGDATRLAQALHDLAVEPERLQTLGNEAALAAERYAWPRVAEQVVEVYHDACEAPVAEGIAQRTAVRIGLTQANLAPRQPAKRIPKPDQEPASTGGRKKGLLKGLRVGGAAAVAGGLTYFAIEKVGLDSVIASVVASRPIWVFVALAVMCLAMVVRAVSWHATLKAAVPEHRARLADAMQGTSIGVLMSATLPARLGELSRALIVARRMGRARERFPVVIGTLVSQTILNILALIILGAVMFATVGFALAKQQALLIYAIAPVVLLVAVLIVPLLLRSSLSANWQRAQRWREQANRAMGRVRAGLRVFRNPRLGSFATVTQLGAWALQWLSCYLLLVALNMQNTAGLTAAAAVLFAVNFTAAIPVTPSNIGVFQAACVVVLTQGYGVDTAHALAYGIILQGVEIATAILLGAPALVKEGLSWKEVRLRALHNAPVSLRGRGEAPREVEL